MIKAFVVVVVFLLLINSTTDCLQRVSEVEQRNLRNATDAD